MSVSGDPIEHIDDFRRRARTWLADNLPLREPGSSLYGTQAGEGESDPAEMVAEAKAVQRKLFDAGFAGVAFPRHVGGQGLPFEYARVFNEEGAKYRLPLLFGVTLGIVAPTILDCGTHEQQLAFIPPMLRGEAVWVQLLSEPTNGSDLAGAITKAVPSGSDWVLNGAKMWSTGAQYAKYGLCLARTNWDVPKHRGLSVFAVPMDAPGLTVLPIRQAAGQSEFCQEFLDDVRVPGDHLIGAVDDGWTVVLNHLEHERAGAGGGGIMGGLGGGVRLGGRIDDLAALARHRGVLGDSVIRDLIARVYVEGVVHADLTTHVSAGVRSGRLDPSAMSLLKLYWGLRAFHRAAIGLEVAGLEALLGDSTGAPWRYGSDFINARTFTIAGGTDEMQRNMIAERLLKLPREGPSDKGIPFRDVRTNAITSRS